MALIKQYKMTKNATTTTSLKTILFSLRVGHWEFSPGLIPTLATLLLLPLLLFLGDWQWQRAVYKQNLLDQFAQRSRQTPQQLSNDAPNFTPIQVSGLYDTQHFILLDNRIVNHQVGYDVFVPFKTNQDTATSLLVNLGWIPKNYDLSTLTGQLKNEKITLQGLTEKPQRHWVLAPAPNSELHWPLLVEDLRINELSRVLNRPLYPFILLLTSDSGFTPHWNIVVSVTPERHRGYAVQWFGLALTLLFLYLKLNIRRAS